MFKKLFGTDGIRGAWGEIITPELAFEIGKAVAIIFERKDETNTIVVGRDTRLSGETLSGALIAGMTSMGTNVVDLGIVPTAVVPFAIEKIKANAGIMITASHNPANHNGFKFFNGNGFRISEEQESHVEHIIANSSDFAPCSYDNLGKVSFDRTCLEAYEKLVKKELKASKNLKIAFDCANGASSEVVKEIFKDYNFEQISATPNGLNINSGCGAIHIDNLKNFMQKNNFDIGFSFDGDADRVKVVLPGGKVVSGEDIIYNLTKYNCYNQIVTTKMSNMALSNQFEKEGIKCVIVGIGESEIISGLLENNASFGGENNGHFLLLDKGKSSDGILVSAQILSILSTNPTFSVPYKPYHQFDKAVSVKNKDDIMNNSFVQEKIELCESLLGEKGRILVRASGTEELIRILVEGEDDKLVDEIGAILENTVLKLA